MYPYSKALGVKNILDFFRHINGSWGIPLNDDFIEVTGHTEDCAVSYVHKNRDGKVNEEGDFEIDKDCAIKLHQRIGSALPISNYILIGWSREEMVFQGASRYDSQQFVRLVRK